MIFMTSAQVAAALPHAELVTALRQIYCADAMHTGARNFIELHGKPQDTVIAAMPAWGPGYDVTNKVVTIFPGNNEHGLPTIHAVILVFDEHRGFLKAVVDGTEVTARRTTCMSALATDYLARADARRLLIIGSGALAPHAALAQSAVRNIEHIDVWARRENEAARVRDWLASRCDATVDSVRDLAAACAAADIVSSQTSSPEPLIFGEWLRPGTHVDVVGSHSPDRRECDDETARRARIYVDNMESALREAGDVLMPLRNGTIQQSQIVGDLSALSRGAVGGRRDDDEITLFKSTGSALADLAAAHLALRNHEMSESEQ